MLHSEHGGDIWRLAELSGRRAEDILDFSASINPLGPPEWFRPLVSSLLWSVIHYPDPACTKLVAAAVERYGCSKEEVIAGNGSSEILRLLPRVAQKRRAVVTAPSYGDYAASVAAAEMECVDFPLLECEDFRIDLSRLDAQLRGDEIVFLCNPNNPTGQLFAGRELREIATRHPLTMFVVDEAFGDFVEGMDSLVVDRPANVAVLLSLTKIFAIPGVRLGLAMADRDIADSVRAIQPPWSVNTIAQAVGEAALRDTDFRERSRRYVAEQRRLLTSELGAMTGITVYPGSANFLLVRIDRRDLDAGQLADRTLREGVAIRVCDNFRGLDRRFFRVAVKTAEENEKLCSSLRNALRLGLKMRAQPKKPALMFQGTGSNAGKSLLTAAMGRILLQDGFRVAPFKAQNMSLNSYVTPDGGEMGRAQVVQAQACRLAADVRMNPILLKPNSDTGSQVILLGKPVANMDVMEYVRYKSEAFGAVKAAYDSLAAEFDVMVIEGAGSPGEVNLKHHDIVNMHMARYARAAVLLVGDIDRGGVFASFVGTMEVLAEWERSLVAGFVVNRFRGKKDLLDGALEYTRRHTGRPVFGVVPYLHRHGLPEEDSVSFKDGLFSDAARVSDDVEIAVVDLPHISNFTDFDALRIEPDVRVRVVRTAADFNRPDAVILPGSKNTIGDLHYLVESGMASALGKLAADGTELMGICGGFQMLGSSISDPHHLESDHDTVAGLGFLDATTVLASEKTLTRTTGIHLESGLPVRGYEIHHGLSECRGVEPVLRQPDGRWDGARSPYGLVWGTYLHGIFDADEFRRWFIDRLRRRKGLRPLGEVRVTYDLEPALDRLADAVRDNLDMKAIYRLMGLA